MNFSTSHSQFWFLKKIFDYEFIVTKPLDAKRIDNISAECFFDPCAVGKNCASENFGTKHYHGSKH